MIKEVVSVLLLVLVLGDSAVVMHCDSCSSMIMGNDCLRLAGEGFDDMKEYPMGGGESCQSLSEQGQSPFPWAFDFQCNGRCQAGCDLTFKREKMSDISVCSDSSSGVILVSALDQLYSVIMGDLTLETKNNWCNCSPSEDNYTAVAKAEEKVDSEKLEVSCGVCSSGEGQCATFDGMDINDYEYPLPSGQSCDIDSGENYFPLTFEFFCHEDCDEGCMIRYTDSQTNKEGFCSNTETAKELLVELDHVFSVSHGDMSNETKNSWCDCKKEDAEKVMIKPNHKPKPVPVQNNQTQPVQEEKESEEVVASQTNGTIAITEDPNLTQEDAGN